MFFGPNYTPNGDAFFPAAAAKHEIAFPPCPARPHTHSPGKLGRSSSCAREWRRILLLGGGTGCPAQTRLPLWPPRDTSRSPRQKAGSRTALWMLGTRPKSAVVYTHDTDEMGWDGWKRGAESSVRFGLLCS